MSEKKGKDGRKINTGGGTYIEGDVNTTGGDFVGRDKKVSAPGGVAIGGSASNNTIVVGNGNTVTGKVEGVQTEDVLKLVRELRAGLGQANLNPAMAQMVQVNLQAAEEELEKPQPDKLTAGAILQGVVGTLTGLAAASEAVQKLLPMAQQAAQWVQQLVK
jgi:hypothetical protein